MLILGLVGLVGFQKTLLVNLITVGALKHSKEFAIFKFMETKVTS